MKYLKPLILIIILAFSWQAMARDRDDSKDDKSDKKDTQKNEEKKENKYQKNTKKDQTKTINIKHPSSGRNNRNLPSHLQQPSSLEKRFHPPSYGKLDWTTEKQIKGKDKTRQQSVTINMDNAVKVVHHHAYEPNYVRKQLQKLGVGTAPGYIINREEVVHTDKEHSVIDYPKEGFDHHTINTTAFSFRNFNDRPIRTHMSRLDGTEWQERINEFDRTEIQIKHYYWHNDKDFNYCHFIDNSGYHWYGWYLGDKFFWTRHFNNRWWWYDADFDRWCFWNNGFWWWQDPNHIGDLYFYNNINYIPCNSANDNVSVTAPANTNIQTYYSPDKTRMVKVITDTLDAFLYDNTTPPLFNPTYLASGVRDVIFSDVSNGKPLEIILKLDNGSFDMFDGNGKPYTPSPETPQTNQ